METRRTDTGNRTNARFPQQTDWSGILIAGGPASSPEARDSLNRLCQMYWPPLYAFIRFKGYNSHDAKDLTQSFFLHLFQSDFIKKVEPQKGKFRSFLLAALTNFMNDQWQKARAVKRGGHLEIISLDEQEAESHYGLLPKMDPSPEKLYDRSWAGIVVRTVLKNLEQEYLQDNSAQLYQAFLPHLVAEPDDIAYSELVRRLNKNKNALQVAWHRLRRRFGELLRAEIALTVANPADVAGEIKYLLAAWAALSSTH